MKIWALTAIAVVCLACAPTTGVDPVVPADDTPGIVTSLIFEAYARPGICFAPSVDTLHAGTYTVRAGIHGYEDTYPWARATLVVTE